MPSSAWSSDVCSRSEEHTSELQSLTNLVCRLLLEKKKTETPFPPARNPAARDPRGSRRPQPSRAREPVARASFFFNDTAPTEIYTLSLHDALPIFYFWAGPPRLAQVWWLAQVKNSLFLASS